MPKELAVDPVDLGLHPLSPDVAAADRVEQQPGTILPVRQLLDDSVGTGRYISHIDILRYMMHCVNEQKKRFKRCGWPANRSLNLFYFREAAIMVIGRAIYTSKYRFTS